MHLCIDAFFLSTTPFGLADLTPPASSRRGRPGCCSADPHPDRPRPSPTGSEMREHAGRYVPLRKHKGRNGRFRIEYSKRKPELNISCAEVAGYFGDVRPTYSLLDDAGRTRNRLRWDARLPLCPAVVLSSRVEVSESCRLLDDAGSTRRRHRWNARLPHCPGGALSSHIKVLEGCWLRDTPRTL